MKRVLVLGAGLVSRPLVRHLSGFDDVALTLADADIARAEAVAATGRRVRPIPLSAEDRGALDARVAECDLVVSLLPAPLHPAVARAAIAHGVDLITTSYVSDEMRALDAAAKDAGVLLLNETGLDPGIDHMSAMSAIARLRSEGFRIVSFRSVCGGLPAPEANTNPWGYKFSWSPRGVLTASRRPARWLTDGRIVEVSGDELFTRAEPCEIGGLGRFEVHPNRDAIPYAALYGIEGVLTMFRGTLRYPGWSETLLALARLGLLDDRERAWRPGTTYAGLMESFAVEGTGVVRARVAARAGVPGGGAVMDRLAWAGLFSDRPIGATRAAPIDLLCARLQEALTYAEGERDMIVLRHELGVVDPQGREQSSVSTLVAMGEPSGDTAMARTVALPAAIAARTILDGELDLTGVRIPAHPEIYEPVLASLATMGIDLRETRSAP
ncbi:MAG TPA: saccharopine dehydrogenase C-terminal domain-containing protein [Candidatus Polarisedimenticolaceae bacterium]|nr:saccharopine dehydrogenase C-terminal domain-containing protein [Candidatus Polarisedimenticolaceae bacterium]